MPDEKHETTPEAQAVTIADYQAWKHKRAIEMLAISDGLRRMVENTGIDVPGWTLEMVRAARDAQRSLQPVIDLLLSLEDDR